MLNKTTSKYLNKKINELENFCQRIEKGVVTMQELEDAFYNLKDEIKNKLIENSDEWRLFDNWNRNYLWRNELKSGIYAKTGDKNKIEDLIIIIKKLLNENNQYNPKKEKTFAKEQDYEALRYILNILKSAKEKIIIVDNYLDEIVFDFIDAINKDIQIFLITDNQKQIFKRLYLSVIGQRDKISAKYNNQSHDRYIIIDDIKFYHLGASLNTIGKKEFMIQQIEEEKEKQIKLNNFKDWWSNGVDVV